MTKKHFIALAKAIAQIQTEQDRRRLCDEIGEICAKVNREFSWTKWRSACGC